ncbi:hypothetical protein ACH5RR_040726 [Cinchona calisaya]|uniref:Uncharacterized protein n=1 Tax=Cinchona calisaya TaxID=153742 RepID=A0ABD2XUS6_9GENT
MDMTLDVSHGSSEKGAMSSDKKPSFLYEDTWQKKDSPLSPRDHSYNLPGKGRQDAVVARQIAWVGPDGVTLSIVFIRGRLSRSFMLQLNLQSEAIELRAALLHKTRRRPWLLGWMDSPRLLPCCHLASKRHDQLLVFLFQ